MILYYIILCYYVIIAWTPFRGRRRPGSRPPLWPARHERLAEYGRKPHRMFAAQKTKLSRAPIYGHMRETQGGTVSSNLRFQAVLCSTGFRQPLKAEAELPGSPGGKLGVRFDQLGKGQMGSALMGSLRISCFWTGTFWLLPLTYFSLPKSARAYPFPQSVKIDYFRNGPISVDPICPQPTPSFGSPLSWFRGLARYRYGIV